MSTSPVPSGVGESLYERTPEVIGRGAFSVVYKGRHKLTGQSVALKVFNDCDDVRFMHTIKCFDRMHSRPEGGVGRWSPAPVESEMASIRNESVRSIAVASYRPTKEMAQELKLALVTKELIVSLLDYSRGPDGKTPGKENGEFFIIMELGDLSLEEYIEYRSQLGQPFSLDEIRSILYDVTRMVCLLHSHGLAHLDIKPANIMLFNSTFWKLIDFDGCFRASSSVDVCQSDIAFTALYCAPEIAAVIVKMSTQLKISRLMDVWSVGTIGAELVLMKPYFENAYMAMYDDSNKDDSRFLKWLGDERNNVNDQHESLKSIDHELRSLIFDFLLVKDVRKRSSLPAALKHTFFSNQQPVKLTWNIPSVSAVVHESNRDQRTLNLNLSEISFDPSNPLESDDANALLHDSSADEDDRKPGLSPLEVTPLVSPNAGIPRRSLLRYLCCKLEGTSS